MQLRGIVMAFGNMGGCTFSGITFMSMDLLKSSDDPLGNMIDM